MEWLGMKSGGHHDDLNTVQKITGALSVGSLQSVAGGAHQVMSAPAQALREKSAKIDAERERGKNLPPQEQAEIDATHAKSVAQTVKAPPQNKQEGN
jgi:hypothetical protein